MNEKQIPADLLGAIVRELNKKPTKANKEEISLYYEKIFEISPEPMVIADCQGRIIRANEAFGRTFGFSSQEIIGEYLDSVAVPAELKKDTLAMISLVLRGERVEQESFRQHQEGHSIPVFLILTPIFIDNQIEAILAIYRDLSPLQKLTTDLKALEKKLMDIAAAAIDWLWETNEHLNFIFVSPRVKQILGYEPEEVIGKSFFDFISASEVDKIRTTMNSLKEKGQPIVELECWHQTKSGEKALILINGFPIKDDKGETKGYRGVGRDITSRNLAEERLQKKMTKFAAMIEGIQEGILLVDEKNIIVEINNYFLRLLGEKKEAVLGKNLLELEPIADLINLENLINEFKNNPQDPPRSLEHSLFGLEMIVRFQPVYYQSSYDGLIINLIDVSELVKARNQALTAEKVKSEFLANISHEIHTPLNGILGMINLFLETKLTPDQKEYLKGIKNSAESLLDLIKDILDFSQIEGKRIELEKTTFNLVDLVFEAIASLTYDAHKKKLELLCDIPPSLPSYVKGDPGRLSQILINLLSNAVKFTEKGEIIISLNLEKQEKNESLFHFVVADTGIGIPKEKLDIIFKAFTQADSSMTRKFGGTGLGLAITQELVNILNGRIWVESEVGVGSRFHVEIKLELAQVPEEKRVEEKEALGILAQTSALIIDDNTASRRILKSWLTAWGIKTEETESGEDAIVLMQRTLQLGTPFDFILLDSSLSGTGSFFLQDFLKQEADQARRTIIMRPSPDHKINISLWQKAGLKTFITKPVRPSELLDSLLSILGKKALPVMEELTPSQETELEKAKYRILLAEDNLVNQKVACFILERHGHEVVAVKDGIETLEALERGVFDLVLMDVQMPRMDGFAATREIRKKERGTKAHLPVIAMTAHALKGDKEKCLAAGMDDYVTKPLRADELLGVIEKTVNRFKRKSRYNA